MHKSWYWPGRSRYPIYQNRISTGSGSNKWGLLNIRIWYPRPPKLKDLLFINWDYVWIDLDEDEPLL